MKSPRERRSPCRCRAVLAGLVDSCGIWGHIRRSDGVYFPLRVKADTFLTRHERETAAALWATHGELQAVATAARIQTERLRASTKELREEGERLADAYLDRVLDHFNGKCCTDGPCDDADRLMRDAEGAP